MNSNNQACLLGFYLWTIIQVSPLTPIEEQAEDTAGFYLDNKTRILVVNIKTMSVSLHYSKCKHIHTTPS